VTDVVVDEPVDRPEPVLSTENVVSGYTDAEICTGASVDLGDGELVVVIGPNGAGKSTLLKTIFGLIDTWEGTIRLGGRDITGLSPRDRVLEGMAYVPQTENVFPRLTVTENLEMGAYINPGRFEERRDHVEEIFPALEDKRRAKAMALSGGQRQMLAFGRALMTDPDVLLLDEPSAGLQPSLVDQVLDHVERVRDAGTSIMLVEQNARQALQIADWAYVLDEGSERYEGPGPSVLEDPEIGRLYLGG
jgi:branched-chain amino acid transport system ATP-binding protein